MTEQPAVDLSENVDRIVEISNQFGPLIFRGLVLMLIALVASKYIGRLLSGLLIRMGVSERRALLPVTALHLLILMIAALFVLSMMGFPAFNLSRFLIATAMVILALFVILKPYLPGLPFKTGDLVSHGPIVGEILRVTFANTMIRTFDGKTAIVPNHKLLNEALVNLSVHPYRRADVEFFIPYDEDLDEVRRVVSELLQEDDRVLEEPSPVVVVTKLAPSYREMMARFWVERGVILPAPWAIREKIDRTLSQRGIRLGVPRIEVVSEGGGDTEALKG